MNPFPPDAEPKRRLVSHAQRIPTDVQHESPCDDCPWRRDSLPGWLGPLSPQEWVESAHGEDKIPCHSYDGPQCAGSAIYRRNVAKSCRDATNLRLPADREKVFATPNEFKTHHTKLGLDPGPPGSAQHSW